MNVSPTTEEVPILVVEQDEGLRETFAEVLTEGGYTPTFVSSLADAYQLIDTQTYALVLTDLFAGRSRYEFSDAHRLRRYASPTPVGLLTTQAISSEEACHSGFAFGLRLPFDIEELLGCVAATINQPFTPEQQERAEVAQCYFAALETGDWMTVLSLCADDVAYYPPRDSVLASVRRLRGKSALRGYLQISSQHYTSITFTNIRLYPCPRGIAVRYTSTWVTPDEYWHHAAETTHFHFDGLRIRQVGVRVHLTTSVLAAPSAG